VGLEIKQIVEVWTAEKIDLRAGADISTVQAIFQSVDRALSADVLALYMTSSGMKTMGDEDSRSFSFWPLEDAAKSTMVLPNSYFAFGDGILSSHRYSFHFENPLQSSVYGDYSDGKFIKLADNVEHFFTLLIENPGQLWLP